MKKARCVPTIVSAALSLAFPLHSVFSYLKKNALFAVLPCAFIFLKDSKSAADARYATSALFSLTSGGGGG